MNEYYNKATGLMSGQMREGLAIGPEVDRKMPPVGVALGQLEKDLAYLSEVVCSLEQRLSPVMRPVPQCTSSGDPDYPGGSAIVAKLSELSSRAREISAQVHAMLDCIEL